MRCINCLWLASAIMAVNAAWGADTSVHAADPVKIGMALPLTGAAASYGIDAKKAAEMAGAEINTAGGILGGRRIEIIFEDDKGTPQGGVAAVQKLISHHGVSAVTGGINSSVVLAETSVTKNRILHVNTTAQADAITEQKSPWLFQINSTASTYAKSLDSYLVRVVKPSSIAFLSDNSEQGKAVLAQLKRDLEGTGTTIVSETFYDSGTNDFTSIITRIKAQNPNLVYVTDAYVTRVTQLWKQIRQLGGFPVEVMGAGLVGNTMVAASEGALNGVFSGEIWSASDQSPASQKFVAASRAKYGEPDKGHLVAYESIIVIAAAMDKAGTDTDYDKLANALRTNAWPTPRGDLTFDEKGRAAAKIFVIQKVVDGKLTEVEQLKLN